jgi:hypothetical protein
LGPAEQSSMVHHDAAILDHLDAGVTKTSRRRAVMDSELHPNRFGARIESKDLIDMAWNVFGGAEHVHDIDLDIDLGKIRAARLVENGRVLWVDWRNLIPGLLQVLRDSIGILARMFFDPYDGYVLCAPEELENLF